jgi:hypothetical protein
MKEGHVMEYLRSHGHVIKEQDQLPRREGCTYNSIPFSPSSIVDVTLHALLTSHESIHFYTDGKKIYVQGCRGTDIGSDLLRTFQQNVVAVAVMQRLPNGFADRYRQAPRMVLESDTRIWRVPEHLLEQEELHRLGTRIRRQRPLLEELVTALKQDKEPYPSYALVLQDVIELYSGNNGG